MSHSHINVFKVKVMEKTAYGCGTFVASLMVKSLVVEINQHCSFNSADTL